MRLMLKGPSRCRNNFPVSKITSSDEMTITAELANGQVYVLSSAWLHGEANAAEEGTVDLLEFHGEEWGLPVMKELELKKPITAHGETLSVLEFDEPTGKDVRELGYPYQMNQDESVKLLAHVVSKYIVRLAKVPQSSVDQMSPADLNAAAWLVAGFFLQA